MSERASADESQTLVFERELSEPVDKVWRALTDSALLARWLMRGELPAREGARFVLDDPRLGRVHCELLELEPERRLRYRWHAADAAELDSTVTFLLTPTVHCGTLLRVVQTLERAATRPEARAGGFRCAA